MATGDGAVSERGYSLVVLLVAVTVLNILVAAALPYWSKAIQREKEEELIYRGLQYAEGIRLYQRRFGQLPTSLEQLIEVEPRCMRQLYEDPMTENGEWGLLFANAPGPGAGPGDPNGEGGGDPEEAGFGSTQLPGSGGSGLDGETVTAGPITGVFSRSTEDSILVWNGEQTHDRWHFTVDLVSAGLGGGPQQGNVTNTNDPNGRPQNRQTQQGGLGNRQENGGGEMAPGALINLRWLGRPLPEGVELPGMGQGGLPPGVQDGNLPGAAPPGGGPGGPTVPVDASGRETQ